MYVIDGIFLTRTATGIQRFANNIVDEMDKLASPGQFQLLVPESYKGDKTFKNIEIVRYGKNNNYVWEQIDLGHYLRKHKAKGIFFENAVPFFYRKGLIVLHDISYKVNPGFFCRYLRGCVGTFVFCTLYRAIAHSKMKIVTVSNFSKQEIIRCYKVKPERITVAGNGWQHMNGIPEDDTVFERMGIGDKPYYFAMATNAPNKNLKWILSAAKAYPDELFVIAGNLTGKLKDEGVSHNVILAGFISDSEAKSLMKGCKAFLFPTLYEGFGIPPMEALASGAKKIIVSDTPCMHEIYKDVGCYVDPLDYDNINLEFEEPEKERVDKLLGMYSWEKYAKMIMNLLL